MQVFDIDNQQEVVKLLGFVRSSTLELDDKNQVRDLILDYVHNKNTEVLGELAIFLAAIDARLADDELGEVAEETLVQGEDLPQVELAQAIRFSPTNVGFGNARPEPTFKAPAKSATAVTSEESQQSDVTDNTQAGNAVPVRVVEKESAAPQKEQEKPVANTTHNSVEKTAPSEVELPGAKAVAPDTSVATAEPATSDIPKEQANSAEAAPVTPDANRVAEVQQMYEEKPESMESHLNRIKEIKHLINEKVGNPVHLVDANNTIGREYLNALLHAMKMTAMDSLTDARLAMDRLEKSYKQVEQFLADNGGALPDKTAISKPVKNNSTQSTESQQTPAERVTNTPTSTPQPQVVEKQPVQGSVTPEESVEVSRPDTEPTEQPAENIAAQVDAVLNDTQQAAAEADSIAAAYKKQKEAAAAAVSIEPKPELVAERESVATQETTASKTSESQANTAITAVASDSTSPQPDMSVADAPEVPVQPKSDTRQTPQQDAEVEPLANTNLQDQLKKTMVEEQQKLDAELAKPEIQAGLDQLLSEWKLFKSSGLFGTGPSGKDHPLYKTLKDLSMATVIAGRFEGVTPEVKQSITDYMNGWRYEHGITHVHTETFEHYLKRVINRILDDYKKPR